MTHPAGDAAPRPPDGRILFATIAAGGAHVSTAHALAEAVERVAPGRFELDVMEPMPAWGFERLDRRHKESWRRMLRDPASIVRSQRLIDRVPAATVWLHRLLLDAFARRAARELAADPPALVVVNHGWLTVAFTRAQRRYGLAVPVLTFETSTVNANALWADRQAERFVVASPVSKRRLARLGVAPERVDVVGYPVREGFLRAPSRKAARARLGLEPERFTVLVSTGGEGVGGDPDGTLKALEALGPEAQAIVIAGRNEALRERLEGARERLPRLRPEGFVEDMALRVAAADVVVAKTGPATVFETLAVGRPVVATQRFGIVENKMIAMLEAQRLGRYAPTPDALAAALAAYRDDAAELERVAAACRGIDFEAMGDRLGRYLLHYAREGEPLAEVVGGGLELFEGDERYDLQDPVFDGPARPGAGVTAGDA